MRVDKTIERLGSCMPEDLEQGAYDVGHALPLETLVKLREFQSELAKLPKSLSEYRQGYRKAIEDILVAFLDSRRDKDNLDEGFEVFRATPLFVRIVRQLRDNRIWSHNLATSLKVEIPLLASAVERLKGAGLVESVKPFLYTSTLLGRQFLERFDTLECHAPSLSNEYW